jgi:hypothetical protein
MKRSEIRCAKSLTIAMKASRAAMCAGSYDRLARYLSEREVIELGK